MHKFSLEPAELERGIHNLGAPARFSAFFDKLANGEPVSIGVLGASVALNGGCFDQPGNRCMSTNGKENVSLVWGEPRVRPFEGTFVRWVNWLRWQWPRSQISLLNSARDASSLSTIVPCIFTKLPKEVDLVVIEAGSMWLVNRPNTVEHITRQFLSMRRPPAVLLLTVHAWCTFGGSEKKKTLSYGLTGLPKRSYAYYPGRAPGKLNVTTAFSLERERCSRLPKTATTCGKSDVLEDGLNEVCRWYNASCLSQRDALLDGFLRARPGFRATDIAGDCLHPIHGLLGTEYLTDILVHWTSSAAAAAAPHRGVHSGRERVMLPPPMDERGAEQLQSTSAACYDL